MKNNSKLNIKNLSLPSIGVVTYKLSKELKEYLPTMAEIEESLVEYLKGMK